MLPPMLQRSLAQLRRRERGLAFLWGASRWFALVCAGLAVASLTDWLIDRERDTPWTLRYALTFTQMLVGLIAGAYWLLPPLVRRLSDRVLALRVEARVHEFGHRLITAVELQPPAARSAGMSADLIEAVTWEAEALATTVDFRSVADRRRLRWSLWLAGPCVLTVLFLLIGWPGLTVALLGRQLLCDWNIPRSVALESVDSDLIWPAGETLSLEFRAQGRNLTANHQGVVRVTSAGQPVEEYPLVFERTSGTTERIFAARILTPTADFTYRAWLGDGRTRQAASVHLEPRPDLVELQAWQVLPEYVGLRPNGSRYEQAQPHGDVAAIAASAIHVKIRTQKPICVAVLEFLTAGSGPGAEQVSRSVPLSIHPDGTAAEGVAPLRAEDAAYRIRVRDSYGFENRDPPRRRIRILPEEPPRVAFLPERFADADEEGTSDESEVEGVPAVLGGGIRMAYVCSSPYGLGHARLRYRINEGPWRTLPLSETPATAESGAFDPRQGTFAHASPQDQVEFHAAPSLEPDQTPGRLTGGGRFDFQTRALRQLQVGDRIEYAVEVFDRNPDPNREPGRTEWRIKTIVTPAGLEEWVRQTLQEETRLRQLETGQRGVFPNPAGAEAERLAAAVPAADGPETAAPAGLATSSFLRQWQLLGPFAAQARSLERPYPPEQEKINLIREYDTLRGRTRWKPYTSPEDGISLDRFFGHQAPGVAYAVCWIKTRGRRPGLLSIGSDDGIKIWIDRKPLFSHDINRSAAPGQDQARLEFSGGWQEILVKVDNSGGNLWGFYLELRDAGGQPLKEFAVRSTPPPLGDQREFLREWLLLGPFANADDQGHQRALPPETEPVDPARAYTGVKGPLRWRSYQSPTDRIDLDQALVHREAGVAYAACWIRTAQKRAALLATGSDDGIKAWINRRLVLDQPVHREAVPGDDQTPVELAAGWNELLLKIDNRFGAWAFFCELRDPATQRSLEGLEIRTTPPPGPKRPQRPLEPFVRSWQLLGPFPSPDLKGLDKVFPPESDPVRLDRSYDTLHGKERWKPHRSAADRVDLGQAFKHGGPGVGYGLCWVFSDRARPVLLRLGSDDGIKIWLNRQLIITRNVARSASPGQDSVRSAWRAGWNEILVKVDNRAGDWAFYLELLDPATGKIMEGIEVQNERPTELTR